MMSSALVMVALGLATVTVDRSVFTEALADQVFHIKGCYERFLELNPALGGRVVAHWTIDASGAVKSLRLDEATPVDPALVPCLRYRLERVHFKMKTPDVTSLSFAFVFRNPNTKDGDLAGAPDSMAIEVAPSPTASVPLAAAKGPVTAQQRARDWINAVRRGDLAAIRGSSGFPLTIVGYQGDADSRGDACGGQRADRMPGVGKFHFQFPMGVVIETPEEFESRVRCFLEDIFLREYIPRSTSAGTWLPDERGKATGRMKVAKPTTLSAHLRRYNQRARQHARDHVLVDVVMTDNNGVTNSALLALRADDKVGFVVDAVYLDELFED